MKRCLLVLAAACLGMTGADTHRILVHGHRGARAIWPENTIPAFEYAMKAGVDVLELDLGITKDNIVVVSHDSVLKAPICSGPKAEGVIHSLTLAEVKQWDCGKVQNPQFATQHTAPGTRVPTLEEVFDLASKGSFQFNIETKIDPRYPELTPDPETFAKLVLGVIRKHHTESRVILQSFDFRTLHAMKKLAPEIRLSALYTGAPKSFVEIAKEAGAPIISPEYHLVTEAEVKGAHAAGLQVVPWTANKPEDWARLKAAGVDAIISDDPASLIAFLKK